MTTLDLINVVMRYIHIVSAVVAVGGMACILICLTPAVRVLDESFRDALLKLVHHRFQRVVWVCIAGLTLSGVWRFIQLQQQHAYGKLGHALIGTKILLALILFAIVFLRSVNLIQPKKPRTILMINIHLAAIIILLGAILQYLRTT
ncbi:MAG: hypothetical protein K8S99_15985 [Planctomycetes bacterium]|nr:hypothetical protein [Planctomycetota bacterium]